jgi:hypothetical protein
VTVTPVTSELAAATVTLAELDFVGSTVLVPVIVETPAVPAVKTPAVLIDPPVDVHVTD